MDELNYARLRIAEVRNLGIMLASFLGARFPASGEEAKNWRREETDFVCLTNIAKLIMV